MVVIDDLQSETIDTAVKRHINEDAKIDSDNSTSYTNLKDLVAGHCPKVIPKQQIGKLLPWVHIAISNAKRLLSIVRSKLVIIYAALAPNNKSSLKIC